MMCKGEETAEGWKEEFYCNSLTLKLPISDSFTDSLDVRLVNTSKAMNIFRKIVMMAWSLPIQKSFNVTWKHQYMASFSSLQQLIKIYTQQTDCVLCCYFTYLSSSYCCVRMFFYQRKISEELWQKIGDFASDCSGGVLKFRWCYPAGNDIMGINL